MRSICGSQRNAREAALANDIAKARQLQVLADTARAGAGDLAKIAEQEAKPVEAAEKARQAANGAGLAKSGLRPLAVGMPKMTWFGTDIYGTAQVSNTASHDIQVLRQVKKMAKSGEYEYITMNRSWKVSTGLDNAAGDLRPDIIGVRRDGRIDAFEIMSRSDSEKSLVKRLRDGLKTLPKERMGAPWVIPFPYSE